ncbi:MAG TPA: hypothetical protein VFF79_19260 [Conexibacter sp.]|nr:hypothetical protein [Conexibacter sp.]
MVQVRDVPDEVHRTLKSRAALEGRTLSELLREELSRLAARPSRREVLARISEREPVALDESSTVAVRRMRDAAA